MSDISSKGHVDNINLVASKQKSMNSKLDSMFNVFKEKQIESQKCVKIFKSKEKL